jgi:hypothetical protein
LNTGLTKKILRPAIFDRSHFRSNSCWEWRVLSTKAAESKLRDGVRG